MYTREKKGGKKGNSLQYLEKSAGERETDQLDLWPPRWKKRKGRRIRGQGGGKGEKHQKGREKKEGKNVRMGGGRKFLCDVRGKNA